MGQNPDGLVIVNHLRAAFRTVMSISVSKAPIIAAAADAVSAAMLVNVDARGRAVDQVNEPFNDVAVIAIDKVSVLDHRICDVAVRAVAAFNRVSVSRVLFLVFAHEIKL